MKTVSRLIKRETTAVPQEHAGEGWLPHVDTMAARDWKYRAGQGGIVGKPLLFSPIVSHGRIYLPTSNAIYCIGMPDVEPSADPLPEQPAEISLGQDPQPALVQISPYDVTLKPGEIAASSRCGCSTRTANSCGPPRRKKRRSASSAPARSRPTARTPPRRTKATSARWSTARWATSKARPAFASCRRCRGSSTSTRATMPDQLDRRPHSLRAPRHRRREGRHQSSTCCRRRAIRTTSSARGAPCSWARPTCTTTRSRPTCGSTEKDGRLPDVVGLINSGYTLGIRPGDKQLSIYSWASHDYRTQKRIDFEPKPGRVVSAEAPRRAAGRQGRSSRASGGSAIRPSPRSGSSK